MPKKIKNQLIESFRNYYSQINIEEMDLYSIQCFLISQYHNIITDKKLSQIKEQLNNYLNYYPKNHYEANEIMNVYLWLVFHQKKNNLQIMTIDQKWLKELIIIQLKYLQAIHSKQKELTITNLRLVLEKTHEFIIVEDNGYFFYVTDDPNNDFYLEIKNQFYPIEFISLLEELLQ